MNSLQLFLIAAVVALSVASVAEAQREQMCFVEGWKINPGAYELFMTHPDFGTVWDRFTHKEYMWLSINRNIDLYDLSDKTTFDPNGNPTLAYSIPSGSSCLVGQTFMLGDDFVTYHGNEPECTCVWRAEAPCPSMLRTTIDGVPELMTLGANSIIEVDSISPDLIGDVGQALDSDPENPTYACLPLVNPEAVAGKYCLTDRGGCYFQTKYEMCRDAGAIGTLVTNRDSSTITMSVRDVDPGDILIMIGKPDGMKIRAALDAGKDVKLAAGKGVGPPAPLDKFSAPDPMGVVNMFTGKRDLDTAPFILSDHMEVDYKRKLLYAFAVDGNEPEANIVMNYTTAVDGSYPVLGVFTTDGQFDGARRYIVYQGDKTLMVESVGWLGKINIYDITDTPADPVFLSGFDVPEACTADEGAVSGFDGVQMHPDGRYAYMVDTMDSGCAATLGITGPTGDNDVTEVQVWDFIDPTNPVMVNKFFIDEVEPGALVLNGAHWEFGPDGLVGISMTSAGFVLYDFSDPVNPVVASEVYDPAENVNDFTKGVFDSAYGDDGFWYVFEKDGVDGIHGEWHQLKAVPCSALPYMDVCMDI
jgi:hypothetical protein